MVVNYEAVQTEEIDSNKNSYQLEFETDWRGEEDETEENKHTTTIKEQSIQTTTK